MHNARWKQGFIPLSILQHIAMQWCSAGTRTVEKSVTLKIVCIREELKEHHQDQKPLTRLKQTVRQSNPHSAYGLNRQIFGGNCRSGPIHFSTVMAVKYRLSWKEMLVSVPHSPEKQMDGIARAKLLVCTTQQLHGMWTAFAPNLWRRNPCYH